jgi:hypothetical protein
VLRVWWLGKGPVRRMILGLKSPDAGIKSIGAGRGKKKSIGIAPETRALRDVSDRLRPGAMGKPVHRPAPEAGAMFAFLRKKFSGSYFFLRARSRA